MHMQCKFSPRCHNHKMYTFNVPKTALILHMLHWKICKDVCVLSTCCFRLQILICDHPKCRFGRQHAALHGCVRAFDLGHVHETWTASYQHAARERQLRNWLENVDVSCYTRGKGMLYWELKVFDLPENLLHWGPWLHMLSCCHLPGLILQMDDVSIAGIL